MSKPLESRKVCSHGIFNEDVKTLKSFFFKLNFEEMKGKYLPCTQLKDKAGAWRECNVFQVYHFSL